MPWCGAGYVSTEVGGSCQGRDELGAFFLLIKAFFSAVSLQKSSVKNYEKVLLCGRSVGIMFAHSLQWNLKSSV